MKRIRGLLILLVVGLCFYSVPAQATSVGLELMLLVDVSGSIDANEYAKQKAGYVNAFQDAGIQSLISGIPGGIAVAYTEWSGATQQNIRIGWTLVNDALSANNFASAISGILIRSYSGLTAPGSAINYVVPLFTGNGYEGTRLAIDISGDGSQNDPSYNYNQTKNAAEAALAASIHVNGLPILGSEANLDTWYKTYITDPGGGFMVVAGNIDAFQDAVLQKLRGELNPIPEPATMLLLGSGLIGLAGYARRRFHKK